LGGVFHRHRREELERQRGVGNATHGKKSADDGRSSSGGTVLHAIQTTTALRASCGGGHPSISSMACCLLLSAQKRGTCSYAPSGCAAQGGQRGSSGARVSDRADPPCAACANCTSHARRDRPLELIVISARPPPGAAQPRTHASRCEAVRRTTARARSRGTPRGVRTEAVVLIRPGAPSLAHRASCPAFCVRASRGYVDPSEQVTMSREMGPAALTGQLALRRRAPRRWRCTAAAAAATARTAARSLRSFWGLGASRMRLAPRAGALHVRSARARPAQWRRRERVVVACGAPRRCCAAPGTDDLCTCTVPLTQSFARAM
jgi:hypothetical protein